jgi:hypothetical protein
LGDAFPAEIYRGLIAVDHDGTPFINYLRMTKRVAPGKELDWLVNHKTQVTARIVEHAANDKLRAKYQWTADYHDRFCRSFVQDSQTLHELTIGRTEGPTLVGFSVATAPSAD